MTETIFRPKFADSNAFNTNENVFTQTFARAPLAVTDSYYRTVTFTAHDHHNPLTASAAPLLTINARLKQCRNYENINALYQNLVHEIRAFETQAQTQNFRAETILVARYLLCVTLDETIEKTPWGKEYGWNNNLLSTFQREENVGERFFLILERISEDSAHHIDLLELIYLCLNQGFEGKYRHIENGKIQLDEIIDKLYQRIHKQRSELKPLFSSKLLLNTSSTTSITTQLLTTTQIIIVSITCFLAIIFVLSYSLNSSYQDIFINLQHIQQTLLSL